MLILNKINYHLMLFIAKETKIGVQMHTISNSVMMSLTKDLVVAKKPSHSDIRTSVSGIFCNEQC